MPPGAHLSYAIIQPVDFPVFADRPGEQGMEIVVITLLSPPYLAKMLDNFAYIGLYLMLFKGIAQEAYHPQVLLVAS